MKTVLNKILSVFSYFFTASFLQESDMFMDALTASTKKEPRKRKRRISSSKDGPETKKEPVTGKEDDANKESTPPSSPFNSNEDNKSPPIIRPLLKVSNMTNELSKCDFLTSMLRILK
jgi:protein phosphatase 1 regulatory subunit 10